MSQQIKKTEILSPVGRYISGDAFVGNTTDQDGKPLVYKTGKNAGQSRTSFDFGIAIAKTDPGWPAFYAVLDAEAKKSFPQLFDAAGQCLQPAFSWKVTDGDSTVPNKKLVKPCDREGWAGHYIVFFSSSFAPKVFNTGGATEITDPKALVRGYFVRVFGTVSGNNQDTANAGLYLGHSGIEFIAYGPEMAGGFAIDGASVFGTAPAVALPAGASATPLAEAPTTEGMGATPAVVQPAAVAPAVVQAAGFLAPQAAAAVEPAAVAPAVAAVAPAVAAPVEVMRVDPNGNAFPESTLLAAGWTQENINLLAIAG